MFLIDVERDAWKNSGELREIRFPSSISLGGELLAGIDELLDKHNSNLAIIGETTWMEVARVDPAQPVYPNSLERPSRSSP